MDLNNFEEIIDPVILQRGIDYYLEGRVRKTQKLSERNYSITIDGTNIYNVEVELGKNNKILQSNCNCPYEGGPVCKHQVAAFYALKEEGKPSQNKGTIADLLNSLDKQELVQLILHWTKENPKLEDEVMWTYGKPDPAEQSKKIKQSIRNTINQYKGSDRFIHYRQSFDFIRDLSKSLDLIKQVQSPVDTFTLLLYVYKEGIKAIQYTDDSGGVITDLLSEIRTVIIEKVEENRSLPQKEKRRILNKVKTTVSSKVLEDWPDDQVQLLEAFIGFIEEPKLLSLYMTSIEERITVQQRKPYGSYIINQWLSLKSQVIYTYESKETYQTFLEENKTYSSIRKKWFDWLFDKKQYERLIAEAKEAEEENQALAGLVHDWQEYRYIAYKALNKVEDQKELAFQFLMSGRYDYYHELKELEENQAELYKNVKEGFKQTNSWKAEETYLKIMLEEEDTEELLTYVQRNPYYITRFSELLYPLYPAEVEEAYQTIIKKEAKQASNRKQYKKVCKLITQYGEQTKAINKRPVVEELEAKYPQKPAFLDELGKVK